MSKESEALNYLVCLAVVGNKENHRGKIFDSEEIVLKVLKRKEPMKPTLDENGNYRCARCHHIVDNHYCSDCGGALDWSNE